MLTNDVMRRHAYQQLMQHPTHEEHSNARRKWMPSPAKHRRIDMPLEELIHRLIPRLPIRPQAIAVPPIIIEAPVREPRHLGQRIQKALEKRKEARQPDHETDGGELEQPLQDRRQVQRIDLVQTVPQHGRCVLRRSEPDEDAQAKRLSQALGDKDPADPLRARIYRLVDERRRPPEVDEVAHGDVLRVRTGRVQRRQGLQLAGDRMQVRMAQIAVGEGVARRLEPDYDGMQLGQGADEWVVDGEIDRERRNGEREGNVDGVRPGDDAPRCLEAALLVFGGAGGAVVVRAAG
jgi:hypothetical protein